MCEEWKNDYLSFKSWAESHGYEESLTIDRIDVDGNYEPSNCRWVDRITQGNNKRNTKLANSEEISRLARQKGIVRSQIALVRVQHGWSVEDAVSIPTLKKGEKLETWKKAHQS